MLYALKNIHKTFYCASFYRALLLSGKGIGFGFIFLIMLITIGQTGYLFHTTLRALVQDRETLFDSLPPFEIKDGTLRAEGALPKTIELLKDREDGPLLIVIDTDATVAEPDALDKRMQEERILFLINKNAVSYFNPDTKIIETSPTETTKNNTITRDEWSNLGKTLLSFIFPISLLVLIISLLIGQLLVSFFGAVILFVVSPLFKVSVGFKALMRLSVVASLPPTIVFLFISPVPMLQVLLWFGFAVFGLLASKSPSPKGETTP